MHPDLQLRRSVLVRASLRFEKAEADWRAAVIKASELVPQAHRYSYWSIGHPGSRIRELYNRRDKALNLLTVALLKFESARHRVRERQAGRGPRAVLLLARKANSF
ncbi:hypothetical protein [Leisingera caerulea]|uniref:hypothetical protein n=1 Tax=Leisingera caerulea TaxID=506591 RepID=UPI0021A7B3BE|nr:hypothetical protein [Leisingera caerulea]UWQ86031.1 hypothetical protein K3726_20570 [Leisingera caerulea]